MSDDGNVMIRTSTWERAVASDEHGWLMMMHVVSCHHIVAGHGDISIGGGDSDMRGVTLILLLL